MLFTNNKYSSIKLTFIAITLFYFFETAHKSVAMLVKDLHHPWRKSTRIARQLISRGCPRHAHSVTFG